MGYKTPASGGSPSSPKTAPGSPTAPTGSTSGPSRARSFGPPSSPTFASGAAHSPFRRMAAAGGVSVRGPEVETRQMIHEGHLAVLDPIIVVPGFHDEHDVRGVFEVSFTMRHESKPSLTAQAVDVRTLTEEQTKPTYSFVYTKTLVSEGHVGVQYQSGYTLTEEQKASISNTGIDSRTLTEEHTVSGQARQVLYNLNEEATVEMPINTDRKDYTGGNITLNSTVWANVNTGLDITLPAAAGQWAMVGLSGFTDSAAVDAVFDIVSVVAGSPVNSWAGTTSPVNSNYGVIGWYSPAAVPGPISGSITKQLVAGDISAGQVTLRLRYQTKAATNRNLQGTTAVPLTMWAEVHT